jgi:hypothetical protein
MVNTSIFIRVINQGANWLGGTPLSFLWEAILLLPAIVAFISWFCFMNATNPKKQKPGPPRWMIIYWFISGFLFIGYWCYVWGFSVKAETVSVQNPVTITKIVYKEVPIGEVPETFAEKEKAEKIEQLQIFLKEGLGYMNRIKENKEDKTILLGLQKPWEDKVKAYLGSPCDSAFVSDDVQNDWSNNPNSKQDIQLDIEYVQLRNRTEALNQIILGGC